MQVLIPKLINSFDDRNNRGAVIEGVCASRFHSVFWNKDRVYTCGLNAGALGHLKGEKTIVAPKQVSNYLCNFSKTLNVLKVLILKNVL